MVTDTDYLVSYDGRSDTGPYAITFDVQLDAGGNAKDIKIYAVPAATDEPEDITATSTISGLNVYTALEYTPPSGEGEHGPGWTGHSVVLVRDPAVTQPYSLPYGGKLPHQTIADALDRLCFVAQKLLSQTQRSLRIPFSDDVLADLPPISTLLGKLIGIGSDGAPAGFAGASSVPVSAVMEAVLAASTLQAARTALEVPEKGHQQVWFDAPGATPDTISGSVEISGQLITLDQVTPSGSPASPSSNWVYVTEEGAAVLDTVGPTWSAVKGGWYNAVDRRAVAWIRVDSSGAHLYYHILRNQQQAEILFEETILTSWDMNAVDAIVVESDIPLATIVSVEAIIIVGAARYVLPRSNLIAAGTGGTEIDGEIVAIADAPTPGSITVARRAGGAFDAAGFDAATCRLTIRHKVL